MSTLLKAVVESHIEYGKYEAWALFRIVQSGSNPVTDSHNVGESKKTGPDMSRQDFSSLHIWADVKVLPRVKQKVNISDFESDSTERILRQGKVG